MGHDTLYMSMNIEKVKHQLFRVRKLAMKFYVVSILYSCLLWFQ